MYLINARNMEHVKLMSICINKLHILNRNERSLSVYEDPKTLMWESLVHIRLSIIVSRTVQKLLIEFTLHREQAYSYFILLI